ncbi:glycosyltransferase [Georgenia sp. H159]|uniref:glycosyltransferase n=1 Tax=Georgenia sp. H159 TaxID=3076115 RepID=UPI002D79BD16|nr:glycosyltransferase [Georgenia sp. H159]
MTDAEAGAATTLAVVVSPGVSPYLSRTLRGLAEQTRPVGTVLLVDTSAPGREVGTGVPVQTAVDAAGLREVSTVRVLRVPAPRTFGAAVRAALADHEAHLAEHARRQELSPASPERWLWLLHDDSAPEPRAHAALLLAGESGPSVALAGPKQRDWAQPDLLLEVGVRATPTGRRVPDIENGEIDQGQHDSREDVLAVGTAGVLVRRTVWDELGGPDPSLGPFSDGLDLSQRAWLAGHRVVVVPDAVVHHARASYQGLRDLSSPRPDPQTAPDPRRSFAARRRSQLFLWLTTTPPYWVPLVVVAILALAPVRALWRVTTKEIGLVGAEMRAAAEVLVRPAAVWRARRRHRRTRRVPLRYLRPLQSSWRDVARAKRDERRSLAASRAHRVAPSELEIRERAALARRRRGTLGVLLVGLTAIAVVAFGPLLTAGALRGGALATLDATFQELWRAATSAWVSAGLGHAGPADPLLSVLAVATLPLAPFGGSGNVLTTAVLVLAVPLAGLGAWFAAGAATRSVLLRVWAAAVWALAPALVVATGQGRLGAVLAHLTLPLVALGIARAVGVHRRDVILSGLADANRSADDDLPGAQVAVATGPATLSPGRPTTGSISAAAAAGLALAVACAGAPVLLPAAVVLLLALAVVVPRRRRLVLLAALPPVLLLGPLLTAALADPSAGTWRLLVGDPGVPLAVDPGGSWLAALGWPMALPGLAAGSWSTALALAGGVGVLVAAVLALLRGTGRARAVRAGWLAIVAGLATALLSTRTPVAVGSDLGGSGEVVHGWGGAGVSLALLGVLVAVTAAGDGLRESLADRSFGWRQLSAGIVTTVMVLGPLVTAGVWLVSVVDARGEDPALLALEGRDAPPVPALARELQTGPERSRVLALHAADEAVRAEVWRHAGHQLTETSAVVAARALTVAGSPVPRDEAGTELAALVAQLATGSAPDAGEQLGRLAVGVVLVPPVTDPAAVAMRQDLVARLDSTAGLERVTENASGVIWRTSRSADQAGAAQSVARARVVAADGSVVEHLPSRAVGVEARVPAGGEGRRVVLAERADSGWRATYNGRPLRATTEGWRQAFELPAHTGRVDISYEPAWQLPWRVAQVVGLGLVVLLAVPVRRRREAS